MALFCTKRLSGRYEMINWWTKGNDCTWNLVPIRVPAKAFARPSSTSRVRTAGKLSRNPDGKNPTDVWDSSDFQEHHPEKTVHPCQFPVELVELHCSFSKTMIPNSFWTPTCERRICHHRRPSNTAGMATRCDIVEAICHRSRVSRLQALTSGEIRTRAMRKPMLRSSRFLIAAIDADRRS